MRDKLQGILTLLPKPLKTYVNSKLAECAYLSIASHTQGYASDTP